MAIIHKNKKRKLVIGTVLATVVVVVGAAIFIMCSEKNKKTNIGSVIEEESDKVASDKKESNYKEKVANDERYQHFDYVKLFAGINIGDAVDVRISFPNGEDYIVLSQKEIISIDEAGIVLIVNEEDIMKMSSAKIDMNKYEGANIYAVKYINYIQEPAQSFYLLNEYVLSLCEWNPNLVNKVFSQEKLKKRYDFEQNILKFQIEKEVR